MMMRSTVLIYYLCLINICYYILTDAAAVITVSLQLMLKCEKCYQWLMPQFVPEVL